MSDNAMYKSLINSREWRKLRASYLSEHPLCELCRAEDITRQAEEVHHITPVQTGGTYIAMRLLCLSWYNLQALCRECHHKVHEATVKSWSKAKNQEKAKAIVDGFTNEFLSNDD